MTRTGAPTRLQVVLAFAAIYVVWGSTYLAIRFAIETVPPFLMAGTRFLIAGSLLYAWARRRGAAPPMRVHWLHTGIIGALMLLGGNGAVTWAEQRVPSGLAALLIATVPLWMVLLAGRRPAGQVLVGVILGLTGLGILMGPAQFAGAARVDLLGAGVLVFGALAWSAGSLASRRLALPDSPFLATAMEMLTGGALLVATGLATGDAGRVDLHAISIKSILALLYLVAAGSLVGFTAYIWLLRHTAPARVATYAFVNPVVAVVLGWALAGEPINLRTIVAAAVIIAGVAFIITHREPPVVKPEPAFVPE